jgi:hypothetical protein
MTHPPVPRLAVRIGTDCASSEPLDPALVPQLRASIRLALTQIQRTVLDIHAEAGSIYDSGPPRLSVVSSFAAGAARMVADEALGLGFSVHGVLPCERASYLEQVAAGDEAGPLIEKAESVIELDAVTPESGERADQAAGELILKHCEILLSVFDAHDARQRHPNAEHAGTARRLGIPVVWINAAAPKEVRLLLAESGGKQAEPDLAQLYQPLHDLLLPSEKAEAGEEERGAPRSHLEAYCRERQRRYTWMGWAWGLFFALLGDHRLTAPRIRVRDFVAETQAEWRRDWHAAPSFSIDLVERLEQSLLHAYAWADKLAIYYANAYRSAYLLSYLLGVGGVLCELVADTGVPFAGPAADALPRAVLQIIAFCCLAAIVLIWLAGRRGHWHERWIDYRLLAELLRQLRFLSLLGQVPVFSRMPAYNAYDNPRNTWINWYLRALTRAAGIMPVRFTPAYLETLRTLYRSGLIEDQRRYHERNALRHRRLDAVLRDAGLLAFALTFALLALLVIGTILRLAAPGAAPGWFVWLADAGAVRVLAVWFPIVGGAIAALRTQAELERVAKRSHAMARQLESLATALSEQEPVLSSAALTQVAETAAQTMVSEVLDWRIVFQEKPLELSG